MITMKVRRRNGRQKGENGNERRVEEENGLGRERGCDVDRREAGRRSAGKLQQMLHRPPSLHAQRGRAGTQHSPTEQALGHRD